MGHNRRSFYTLGLCPTPQGLSLCTSGAPLAVSFTGNRHLSEQSMTAYCDMNWPRYVSFPGRELCLWWPFQDGCLHQTTELQRPCTPAEYKRCIPTILEATPMTFNDTCKEFELDCKVQHLSSKPLITTPSNFGILFGASIFTCCRIMPCIAACWPAYMSALQRSGCHHKRRCALPF